MCRWLKMCGSPPEKKAEITREESAKCGQRFGKKEGTKANENMCLSVDELVEGGTEAIEEMKSVISDCRSKLKELKDSGASKDEVAAAARECRLNAD